MRWRARGLRGRWHTFGRNAAAEVHSAGNRIPFARGLGSSSAAIVGGLVAGLVLSGHKVPCWGEESLLQLACGIEGHPDNVAPAIYGGIQIGIHNGERWMSERVPTPPGLQASPAREDATFIMNRVMLTPCARRLSFSFLRTLERRRKRAPSSR